FDWLAARAEVHRPGAALLALQHVQAHVGRDSVEPGAHRRAAGELLAVAPRPYERVLHRILGVEGRGQHPVAIRGQLSAVGLELPEGMLRGDDRALHPPDCRRRLGRLDPAARRRPVLIAEPHHAAVERVLDRLVVVQALPLALAELIALFVRLGFVDDPGYWTPARLAMGGHDPDLEGHCGTLAAGGEGCHRSFAVVTRSLR